MVTKKNIFLRYIAVGFFFFSIAGCASVAHNQYACEAVSGNTSGYGLGYKALGNVLQIGECAVLKSLKIETGDYYYYNKDSIYNEIFKNKIETDGNSLNHFAKAFNCPSESFMDFKQMLVENKTIIFGDKFKNSPRVVNLSVLEYMRKNSKLKLNCLSEE